MKFDIKDKKKNPLMKRDEVIVSIDHAGKATPNRLLVLSEIAKLVKNRPENIIINRITTPGGSTVSEVKVFSYSNKDDIPEWRLKKMEQRASKVKGKPKEEPALTSASKPAPEGEPKPEGEAAQEPAQEKPEQEESKESDQAGEPSSKEEEKPAEEPKKEPQEEGEKSAEASGEEKKEETSGETPADDAEKHGDAEEGTPQGIPSRAQAGKSSVEDKEKREGS